MDKVEKSRSWFCVLNNPQKLFGDEITPEQMVDKVIEMWATRTSRSCAVNYEIGDSGTPHMHMVLEDSNQCRFSALQKLFPSMHIEPTKGNKNQAKSYIEKKGKFEEKGHTVVVDARYHGDIVGHQGKRNDLLDIEQMINDGMKPSEIMRLSINYRKHETLIRKTYFDKRHAETDIMREVKVYWHMGDSGSGKSYQYVKLCELHGEDDVYMMNDYENGGFDGYQGEKVLFMDEYKGGLYFQQFLNYLDVYKVQVHARYANVFALWNEVHISSIYPPEQVYKKMVDNDERDADPISQLMRRITKIIYHYKEDSDYKQIEVEPKDYKNYERFLRDNPEIGFVKVKDDSETPF